MAVYIVTGKLGNGKTLVTVGRIYDAMKAGRRIATNLDLNLSAMHGRTARNMDVLRIPDKPTLHDLQMIGRGAKGKYDESTFGCLVLDECGSWFNSRAWQDKSRAGVNEWFLYARKLRWDVYLIIQDISILDAQAREALSEHTVFCRRLDNIRVPLIGGLVKTLTGVRLKLPRVHRAKVVYGMTANDLVSDVWTYRGNNMFGFYDTGQIFSSSYSHGTYSMLTPWHLKGRYAVDLTWRNIMRITKIYWRRFSSPVSLATGLLLGAFVGFLRFAEPVQASVADADRKAPVVVKSEASPMVQRLKDFYIAGSMQINSSYIHEFAERGKEGGATVYTSQDLAMMGFKVNATGQCRVEVTVDGEVIPIYCI